MDEIINSQIPILLKSKIMSFNVKLCEQVAIMHLSTYSFVKISNKNKQKEYTNILVHISYNVKPVMLFYQEMLSFFLNLSNYKFFSHHF